MSSSDGIVVSRFMLALSLLAGWGCVDSALSGSVHASVDWPHWRGPLGTGVAPLADPPTNWSEGENIRWKVAHGGLGHSTPIVWGERIFYTEAVPIGATQEPVHDHADGSHDNLPVTRAHSFRVVALRRDTGKILWQRTLRDEFPHEGGHRSGSLASASPLTDGEHLFVSFGSRGIFGLTLDGALLWEKDLGAMQTRHGHGEGSSPVLAGENVVVNWDHEGDSFLIALNKSTGEQRWKVSRHEKTSWSTPAVADVRGEKQVIVTATGKIRSYDVITGEVVWECAGLSRNVVASPVVGNGLVFAANSYDWQALVAIRLEGSWGDITDTDQVVWKKKRHTPYVPTPLFYDDALYYLGHNQAIFTRVNALTGSTDFGPVRLPEIRNVFASPLGAGGRIYIADRGGTVLVLRHGKNFEVLAENRLHDNFSASPVAVGKELFLRGEDSLYCIAED